MPALFKQNSFLAGLNRELDEAKQPDDAYPVGVNIRIRTNVVSPTRKHRKLPAPEGKMQGLYVAGSILLLFVEGKAYYADITVPINFLPIAGWTTMDVDVDRISAELVPFQSNRFNRTGTPYNTTAIFNASIGAFTQAVFCFDGTLGHRPQVIFPNGTARQLNDYPSWTMDNPEYVPAGTLPGMQSNKLFLISTDKTRIYSSVSGRPGDFVINITPSGDKGGDAETMATAVSLNEITAIRCLSSGQLLIGTLYATYAITLDYNNTFFGEPTLPWTFLFPAGPINELSIVDLLSDTAFITQSGIHGFNAVAQALRESNNFPIGAKIRGLLHNPQANTCAINHDDYAIFAVRTIYGYAGVVYDTIREQFVSCDLSFGHAKQFANTKISGFERLFFITHENEIFEAFAEADSVNISRIYLGDWTPQTANQAFETTMVDLQFGEVKTSGQVKITIYNDHKEVESAVLEVSVDGYTENPPVPIPFAGAVRTDTNVGFQFTNRQKGWRFGVLLEWNFDGKLTDISVDGKLLTADNVDMEVTDANTQGERFAFVADDAFGGELNPGGNFDLGFVTVDLIIGERYVFSPNGNGPLACGNLVVTDAGTFVAKGNKAAIKGTGPVLFSLKSCDPTTAVVSAINLNGPFKALIGGGDHAYGAGTLSDCIMGLAVLPPGVPFYATAGNHDIDTNLGAYFYSKFGLARQYTKPFALIEFFFYNGGWITANVSVNSSGITTGPTSEPMGNDVNSLQWGWLQTQLQNSNALYKIVVVHEPPYTTDNNYSPGYATLRLPFKAAGAHAVLSGHAHNMQRLVIDGFPYFTCGAFGAELSPWRPQTEGIATFRNNTDYGYLEIKADPLACKMFFRDTNNVILDEYAIYPS